VAGWIFRFTTAARGECGRVSRIATGGGSYRASQICLLIGLAYLFVPIDIIPDHTPYIGHLDEFSFLFGGFVLARQLVPSTDAGTGTPSWLQGPAMPALPNFFIVGAPRCGTTSLFNALGNHPDVFCCPVKEPNYFATDRNAKPWVVESARRRGVMLAQGEPCLPAAPRVATTLDCQTYLSLFNAWSGQPAIGEASTAYLMSADAASAIARCQPDAVIIVVLRQPVERAQSEYLMHAQLGRSKADLDAVLAGQAKTFDDERDSVATIIEGSFYAPQIRRYLEVFSRDKILFLLFEDVIADPRAVLRRVFEHIGVDPAKAAHVELARENLSRAVRLPWLNKLLLGSGLRDMILHLMPARLRRSLGRRYYAAGSVVRPPISLEIFRSDIEQTAQLIGRDLSHWLAG